MTTVTETDIKELKDLIIAMNERLTAIQEESRINIAVTNEKLASLNGRLDTMQTSVIAVTNEKLASLNGRLDTIQISVNKIPELTEKLGELKNWKQVGVVVITAFISSILSGLIGGVIGWLIRTSRFNP